MFNNYEKELFKRMDQTLKAISALERCNKTHCKKEYQSMLDLRMEIAAKVDTLMNQLLAKKISKTKHSQEFHKLLEELKTSETALALMKCSLQECRPKLNRALDGMSNAMQYECKKGKKKEACKNKKTIDDVKKTKMVDAKKVVHVMNLVNKS
jgi:tRNA nucleotidyltransferase/poly(A) polymerase